MKLDPNKYKAQVESIRQLYERNKARPADEIVEIISLSTSIPYMAVCIWLQVLYGSNKILEEMILSLQEFYKYTNIVPLVYEKEEDSK